MKEKGKYRMVASRIEEVRSIEQCYYSGLLIGQEIKFAGRDRYGNEYKREVFEPMISVSELFDIFDEMPTSEKLRLRAISPNIEKVVLSLGFGLDDLKSRIGDGELAEYITRTLQCRSRTQLFKRDEIAYSLLKKRKHLQEKLLPILISQSTADKMRRKRKR